MWFLLIQISLLLLLAAALGAALAWWWLHRTPVADDADPMLATRQLLDEKLRGVASREDVNAAAAHMAGALASLPRTDLEPLNDRLMRLEQAVATMEFPQTDLAPITAHLNTVEASLGEVRAMLGQLRNADLEPLESRIAGLTLPDVDLGPVHSALLTIQLEIDELKSAANRAEPVDTHVQALSEDLRLRSADLIEEVRQQKLALEADMQRHTALLTSAMQENEARLQVARASEIDALTALFAEVSGSVASLRMPDTGPVLSEISHVRQAVSDISLPAIDFSSLELRLDSLQRDVASLDRRPVDFAPLQARISDIDAHIRTLPTEMATRRALEPVERQLASLQEAIRGLPRDDVSAVLDAVYAIDGRQDLIAVESRINAIEYSLAALHHMLRTRPDQPSMRPAAQPRPPIEPAPPPVDPDPVAALRRPGDQANLLVDPAFGQADDLEQINGVGPILASLLRDIGVYYFWQVAEWTPAQADWVDSLLQHFRGRILRDDWVGHARQLAALPTSARRPGPRPARRPQI